MRSETLCAGLGLSLHAHGKAVKWRLVEQTPAHVLGKCLAEAQKSANPLTAHQYPAAARANETAASCRQPGEQVCVSVVQPRET